MTIRSIKGRSMKAADGLSIVAVAMALGVIALSTAAPVAAQVQAVPRAGVSFANTITVRAKIESIDAENHTIAFTTSDGRLITCAVGDGVRNLDGIAEGSMASITYNEVETVLNLRQKGPGAQEARKEASRPDAPEIDSGRFTLTVVAVDLAANKVSVIDGRGGEVRTYAASTVATKDMLKKIKVGDVVIGLTTPMLVTAVTPAQ